MSKAGAAGATVTFALTAGSLPPGLTMSAQSGSGTVITGNPTKAGTFNFTIKATDGGLTSTLAYQITVTVQGPPDQLLCDPAVNGGFLNSGVCVLPDAVIGLPYQGHLVTSHQAGGTLSVVAGSLPPGLSLPATFSGSGDIVGGTSTTAGRRTRLQLHRAGHRRPGPAPVSGLLDHRWTRTSRWPSTLPASGSTLGPGMVGGAYAQDFFLSGGAAPYTWSVASGQLPPGLTLQTFAEPARRQRRARRNTDHGRHLHLHHAAHRLRRPAGHPAIQPHRRSGAADQHHPASGRNRWRKPYSHDLTRPGRRTSVLLVRRHQHQ